MKYLPDCGPATVVLGGSFDPVHRGHLLAAEEAAQQLGVPSVCLLPCHIPPHKSSLKASPQQRLDMLHLAIADNPRLAVDPWELEQQQPSYTYHTLMRFRQERGPDASVIFLMGWDALQGIESWYRWQELLSLGHFAVWQRPGYSALPEPVNSWLVSRQATPQELLASACGKVALLETTPLAVSSSQLREVLSGETSAAEHIPSDVKAYIARNGLYETLTG